MDQPIVKIEIDSTDFDSFSDRFNAYREQLKANPEAWASVNKEIGGTKSAFESAAVAFDRIQKGAENPKVPRVFEQLTKNAKESEKSWGKISKEIEKSSRFMQGLVRGSISFSAFGGAIGAVGALGAATFGATVAATGSVAAQNASSRGLGLELGKESAFNTYFKRFGLSSSDLETMENAKSDVTKQTPLLAAGLTSQQINSEDAEQLQYDFAKRVGKQYSEWEKNSPAFALSQASAYGYTDIYSPDQLRNLGSYSASGELDKAQDQFNSHWRQMGVDQESADKASGFDTNLAADWKKIETAFDSAALTLAPTVTKLADGFADAVSAFANSKEFASDVTEFETAVGGLANAATQLEKAFAWLQKVDRNQAGDQSQLGHGAWDAVKDYAGGHFDKALKDLNRPIVETNPDTASTASEDKILAAIENNESSGNPNAVNPASGAAGLMGIMPANYKKAGINPFDPIANKQLGKKIYDDFLTKYHGDSAKALAAYDGFGGLDKDIAKYGDKWRDHIGEYQTTGETINYLKRIEAQGIDLSARQEQATKDDAPNPNAFKAPATDDFAAGQGTMSDAEKARVQKYSNYIKNLFRDGGGNQFFGPRMNNDQDAPRKANNTVAPQQNIGVSVFTAPGADVSVTGAIIAQ
jgi:hypothetical protein